MMKEENIKRYRYFIASGDCRGILKELPDNSFDLLVTDPPYHTITGGDCGNRPKGMLSGNRVLFKHQNDIEIPEWMGEVFRVLKDGTHAYIMTNALNMKEMLVEAEKVGFKLHNILCWEKNNLTPSQYYMKNCEYVLFLRKGKAKYINNIGESRTVHKVNNIIGKKTHPCEKPIELLKMYILNSSNEGDIVFDPFMGTGSCGVACLKTNRRFFGVERDVDFYEIAKKRIEDEQHMPKQGELFR